MEIYFCSFCGTYTMINEGNEKSCSSCGRMDLLEQVTFDDVEERRELLRKRYNKAQRRKQYADNNFEKVKERFKQINKTIINYLTLEE